MKFGVFYEHQLPKPWTDGQEHRLLHEAIEYSCDLDCAANPDGCPTGTTSQMTTGTSPVIGRCR